MSKIYNNDKNDMQTACQKKKNDMQTACLELVVINFEKFDNS